MCDGCTQELMLCINGYACTVSQIKHILCEMVSWQRCVMLGAQVKEFCVFGTREECSRSSSGSSCDKLHFKKIINKHTDGMSANSDCDFILGPVFPQQINLPLI